MMGRWVNNTKRTNHKNHGLSNRPAQPFVTISLNERNAVINNTETIVRSTINKPTTQKSGLIRSLHEKDDFSVSDTGCSEEKNSSTPIKVDPLSFWLLVQMLFHSKLQETDGS